MDYEIRQLNNADDITINSTSVATIKDIVYYICVKDCTLVPKCEHQRKFSLTVVASDTQAQIDAAAQTAVTNDYNQMTGG